MDVQKLMEENAALRAEAEEHKMLAEKTISIMALASKKSASPHDLRLAWDEWKAQLNKIAASPTACFSKAKGA